MINVKEVAEDVEKLANWQEKKFLENEFWRIESIWRKVYEIIPFYEVPNKRVLEKAEKNYFDEIEKAEIPLPFIKIGGKIIKFDEIEKINKLLPKGYFYHVSTSAFGKKTFILAEIQERKKINGIEEFILGNELVCNKALPFIASSDIPRKWVMGRTKASLWGIWKDINRLRSEQLDEYERFFLSKGLELLGIGREQQLKARPEKIEEKVEEIARKYLEKVIKHEEGHIAAEKYFPYEVWYKRLRMAIKRKNYALECWLRALSDSLADTIESGKIKGTYPFILNKNEPERGGLLYLGLFNLLNPTCPTLQYLQMFEFELLAAFPKYLKTKDLSILKEANSKIFDRGRRLAEKISQADDYPELLKIKEDFGKIDNSKLTQVLKEIERKIT
ncbi:MAG: hypothetical protein QXL88_00380 [Candidatus Pacearchaeota archaeon]